MRRSLGAVPAQAQLVRVAGPGAGWRERGLPQPRGLPERAWREGLQQVHQARHIRVLLRAPPGSRHGWQDHCAVGTPDKRPADSAARCWAALQLACSKLS